MPWLVVVWTIVSLCLKVCHVSNQHKLQSVQNTLARIVTNHRKYAHVAPILKKLHWLPVKYHCVFQAATLVYKCLHSGSPPYFDPFLSLSSCSCSTRRSHLIVNIFLHSTHQSLRQYKILSLTLLRSGMNSLQHQLPHSGKRSKLICFQKPIHHSLPVLPISNWYHLAMPLDERLFPCFLFRCALESVIYGD